MEKRVDSADISVLFFYNCANFQAVYAPTDCAVQHCAFSTVLLALCLQHCAIDIDISALCKKQRWKNVQILQIYLCYFFFGCANLFGCIRPNQLKHCAISTVLKVIYQKHRVLLTLCELHCAISTILLALCYKQVVLLALCYTYSAVRSVLRWLNSGNLRYFSANSGNSGNLRYFSANCNMSRNTRFCAIFGD